MKFCRILASMLPMIAFVDICQPWYDDWMIFHPLHRSCRVWKPAAVNLRVRWANFADVSGSQRYFFQAKFDFKTCMPLIYVPFVLIHTLDFLFFVSKSGEFMWCPVVPAQLAMETPNLGFAWTKSSLNILLMLSLSLAEVTTYPFSQSKIAVASKLS